MRNALRLGLAAALAASPAAALAQMVFEQPSVVVEDPYVIQEPGYAAAPAVGVYQAAPSEGVYEDDARQIAMMHGLVSVDSVDDDWDDNYKVKGRDASGDRMVMTIDKDTGDVLDIDD